MFLATISKPKQLLYFSYVGRVSVGELMRAREDLAALLAELSHGFRLLTDLSQMESMDLDCAQEIGKMMELCDQQGVVLVVRIIPKPAKDIGLNILSLFHYRRHLRIVTCENMAAAAKLLDL